ncbi:MAG TPA: TRAP transporter small permease [Xanthobacteraceae bacterium]|jgi:TRAP-type C4-dicarboxylate transport system permease small subunit|nr:TRAP transporter small permease [Xanthobacteraceae bacterium]
MPGGTLETLIKLNGRVTMWLAWAAAVFLALIATVTFLDVFARYLFLKPFSFTVEVTEFGMALIVFLAVGLVTHDDAHINVDVVTLRLSAKVRAILSMIINAIALAYIAIMVWRLWVQAFYLLSKDDRTQIWALPYGPLAIIMAAGSMFLLTGTIFYLIDAYRRARGREGLPLPGSKIFTD